MFVPQDAVPKAADPTELVVKLVENPVAIKISSSRYILTLQETNKQLDLKLSVSNDQKWVWDSRLIDTRGRAKVWSGKGLEKEC